MGDRLGGPRSALVVATTDYQDPSISRLRSPGHDARQFAGILSDASVGGFGVTTLMNQTAHAMKLGIQKYLTSQTSDTLLVVYVSGHGFKDARGRLFFAATDTYRNVLAATGVESLWLLDRLDECLARRQVLILDCCFSGAFAAGIKGDDDLDLEQLAGHGRGRVVLTASRATEYSFEGHALTGAMLTGSVFTAGLIDGMRSGQADRDGDGYVSVEDAFGHAYDFVQRQGAEQTPQRWVYGGEGTIWLARSPRQAATDRTSTQLLADWKQAGTQPGRSDQQATPRAAPVPPSGIAHPFRPPPSVPGMVVGWGGRNESMLRALATGLEFGHLIVPADISTATAVAAGSRHALALMADGTVRAWGESTFGRTRVPHKLVGQVVGIAAGGSHSVALCRNGTVVGWGNNSAGQAKSPARLAGITAVSAGGWHSLALHQDGQVIGWGDNRYGQATVPRGLRDVIAVAAGGTHSLTLHADGRVNAWGNNDHGQAQVPSRAVGVVAIAAGGAQSVALRSDGEIIVWGRQPHVVPRRLTAVTMVSAGDSHCLALDRDGTIHAWGNNDYEQCAVPGGVTNATAVAAGGVFSLAILLPHAGC